MTPDQKRDAWVRFAAAAVASGEDDRTAYATTVADSLLALMEQREREGRFGSVEAEDHDPIATEAARRMEAKRANRAEAEVERLKAELERAANALNTEMKMHHNTANTADQLHAELGAARSRKVKVESFLKEALGGLRRSREALGPASIVSDGIDRILARARQEGFSDGE